VLANRLPNLVLFAKINIQVNTMKAVHVVFVIMKELLLLEKMALLVVLNNIIKYISHQIIKIEWMNFTEEIVLLNGIFYNCLLTLGGFVLLPKIQDQL
jgi:hypothetical protein